MLRRLFTACRWRLSAGRASRGYVRAAVAWPHSTFKSCVRRGLYPEAWFGPTARIIVERDWGV